MPCIRKVLLRKHSSDPTSPLPPVSLLQSLPTPPPAQLLLWTMCGTKASSPMPPSAEEISGDSILSPHFEVAHRVNVSIVLSTGALTILVVGLILYFLIKKKVVQCCAKDTQAHAMEQGGMALRHQTTMGPHSGFLPSAPSVTQFQASPLPPPSINETEITLARIQQLQQQYTALASQLGTQKPDQKAPEAQGASRLNQYPLV